MTNHPPLRPAACLLAALLALLVGCRPAQSPTGSVTFSVFGDPAELAAYQELSAAFQQRYPQIAVSLVHIPGQAEYRTRIAADFAAGTPPDVFLSNYRRFAPLAEAGAVEPLGPLLAQSSLVKEADFYPQALDAFRWNGELVCLPQNLSSLVVYYNQTLFEQAGIPLPRPGWTWADFLAAAQALTRDSDGDGRIDIYGLGTEASIFRVAPFIWQNGGEIVDNPQQPARLALDSPAALEALQWFIDLQVRYTVVPSPEDESAESSESRFINGRLGMFLNSRRGAPTYRQITAFQWDAAPLPRGRQEATILHADGFCIPAGLKDVQPAWKFIEFAVSVEGQTILAKSGRTVPSLRAVAESPAFLNSGLPPRSSKAAFLDTIPSIRAVPLMTNWVDIERISSEELELAFHGEISVEAAVLTALERTAAYFLQTP